MRSERMSVIPHSLSFCLSTARSSIQTVALKKNIESRTPKSESCTSTICKKKWQSNSKVKTLSSSPSVFVFASDRIYSAVVCFSVCCQWWIFQVSRQRSSQWTYSHNFSSQCWICVFKQFSVVLLRVFSSYNLWALKVCMCCSVQRLTLSLHAFWRRFRSS